MSNAVVVTIKEKTFKLGYGLEVFIKLGELWELDTLEEVNERFQVLTQVQENGKTPLKNMVIMSEIVEGMIKANPDNTETITAVEVRSLSMPEFEAVVSQLMFGFARTMPQAPEDDTEKKPNTRKKSKSL